MTYQSEAANVQRIAASVATAALQPCNHMIYTTRLSCTRRAMAVTEVDKSIVIGLHHKGWVEVAYSVFKDRKRLVDDVIVRI